MISVLNNKGKKKLEKSQENSFMLGAERESRELSRGFWAGVIRASNEQRVQFRSPFSQHFIVYKPPVE
jgi:hypothetical protein